MMKACVGCGELKQERDFYDARARCQDCLKTEARARYHRNRDRYAEVQRNRMRRIRELERGIVTMIDQDLPLATLKNANDDVVGLLERIDVNAVCDCALENNLPSGIYTANGTTFSVHRTRVERDGRFGTFTHVTEMMR